MKHKALLRVLVIAALIRLPYLSDYPPIGVVGLPVRIITALAGIFTVLLLERIVYKVTKDSKLSMWSSLSLILMPWHIEQSRIYSPYLFYLVLGMSVFYVGCFIKNIYRQKLFYMCSSLILFILIIVFNRGQYINTPFQINFWKNIAVLTSPLFIFFKNETFWSGGFRQIGIFLPFTIPIFILGVIESARKLTQYTISVFIPAFMIVFLSASNVLFPEGRLPFLITPFLAVITGEGIKRIVNIFIKNRIWLRITISVYIVLLVFQYFWFFHHYIYHYSNRIKSEIKYEDRIF